MSELASVVHGVACVQVRGHGLGLYGKVSSWCKNWQDCQAHGISWTLCVASKNYCPLSTVSLPAHERKGSESGGSGSLLDLSPCCLSDGCGVGKGTVLLTQTALLAQTHARAGKHPELWNGCVMAAPGWCDRHMIFLWCLLLKDKHLPYF